MIFKSMKPKKVAIIGTNFPSYELYCPNWVGMRLGLEALGIQNRLFSCRPSLDIQEIVAFAPDLVVYGLIDMVKHAEWRTELRVRLPKAKIVLWYGDYRGTRTGQIPGDLSEIDMMFVSNDEQDEYYRRNWRVECHYLPLGSPLYEPLYNSKLDFDFVFIGATIPGNAFGARAMTMGKYRNEHNLKIIDGPSYRPDLREKVFANMPTIYRSSKIVLDQSHFTDIKRYTSNRHWIIPASGGFALTKRFPGCELDYPEGTRAYFDTFEESLELKDFYLRHSNLREKIRLAGHEHAKLHTYDHRFLRMFELLYST